MPRADNDVALDLTLTERAATVRTPVVECGELAMETGETDVDASCFGFENMALGGGFGDITQLDPLRQRTDLRWS